MPVDPTTLAAFALAVTAVVLSPGPDTFLILRYALTKGQKAGVAAVAGVQLGLIAHTAMAVAGLSVIIASSPVLFRTIAIAGAGYSAWLGIQGWRNGGQDWSESDGPMGNWTTALRQALMTNLLNPKVILLFLALYPNFIDLGRADATLQMVTLSAVLILINLAWQLPLVWAAHGFRRWLSRPAARTAVARSSAAVLLAFAVGMFISAVTRA